MNDNVCFPTDDSNLSFNKLYFVLLFHWLALLNHTHVKDTAKFISYENLSMDYRKKKSSFNLNLLFKL